MELEKQLNDTLGKPIAEASNEELYHACLTLVKKKAEEIPMTAGDKKLYYISAEFLIGR